MIHHNFLGHGYFHRDPWVSSDIGAFILGRDPRERGLVRRSDDVFWRFPSDFPERLEEIASIRQEQLRYAEQEEHESPATTHR
jgi:hypothetical protein